MKRLNNIPRYLPHSDQGFSLDPEVRDSWKRLEWYLYHAVFVMRKRFKPSAVAPYAPHAYGFDRSYPTPGIAKRHIYFARDWFAIWGALFSFLVAFANTRAAETVHLGEKGLPCWFNLLLENGFEQRWISDFLTSPLCTFNAASDRAGTFLQIMDTDQSRPDLTWYINHHIPVWYRWSTYEIERVKQHDAWARFVPPAELMQEGSTIITRSPTPPSSTTPTQPGESQFNNDQNDSAPWEAFFASRAIRNDQTIARETAAKRKARLERERRPPRGAKVFEWDTKPGSKILVRCPVADTIEGLIVLTRYFSSEKRYDPVTNEWDCWRYPDEWYQDDNPWDSNGGGDAPHEPHGTDPPPRMQPSPPLEPVRSDEDHNLLPEYEAHELLTQFYGFRPPLPLPVIPEPPKPLDITLFLRILGLTANSRGIADSSIWSLSATFLHALCRGEAPPSVMWDLARDNPLSLASVPRLGAMRRVGSLFVFEFGAAATVPWKLAVTNAADALYVCRLDPTLNDRQLGYNLLERGIALRTLMPMRYISPSPPPSITPPVRLSNYIFTRQDYDAYVAQRQTFLSSPRGRAALTCGGIVWRLAINTMSIDQTLLGPSIAARVHRNGLCIEDSQVPGGCLCDDTLTEDELTVICGAYTCYTGMYCILCFILRLTHFLPGHGEQTARKSWWPIPLQFESKSSGVYYGHWTMHTETLYSEWLAKIETGNWQPKTATEWRPKLKGRSHTRVLRQASVDFSERFLANVSQGGL